MDNRPCPRIIRSYSTGVKGIPSLENSGSDRFAYYPSDIVWEEQNTYNGKGNLLTSTDVYGNTKYNEYDANGNLIKSTDIYGNESTNEYDSIGRVITQTDPNGIITQYDYNSNGQVSNIVMIMPNGISRRLSSIEYDSMGMVSRIIGQDGRESRFYYNASGQQISEVIVSYDPSTGLSHYSETRNHYNIAGQLSGRYEYVDDVLVSSIQYTYDANGMTLSEIDHNSMRTLYTYNSSGYLTELRKEVAGSDGIHKWEVTRAIYDEMGNTVWEITGLIENDLNSTQRGIATHLVYDILGRVIATEIRESVLIEIGVGGIATLIEGGTLVSRTEQGYDKHNRLEWTSNAHGVKTINVYDYYGNVTYTITDLDGDLSTTDDQTSAGKTTFDESGRKESLILDGDGDLQTTNDQIHTKYEYDTQSRVIKTIYSDGTFTAVTYNATGQKSSETDQLGNTTYFEYDSNGRLVAVILPRVEHPDYGFVSVRYEYGYDERGNQISLTDNIYQSDPLAQETIVYDHARTTVYTYDFNGRQTSRTLPDGLIEYFCICPVLLSITHNFPRAIRNQK